MTRPPSARREDSFDGSYTPLVTPDPRLSVWLISHRREIDRRLSSRRSGGELAAASEEAEALRRFRSFASSALLRGSGALPALDGLRAPAERVIPLLGAWIDAAVEAAGESGPALREALEPLGRAFGGSLKEGSAARKASGTPRRSSRRAVSAAIDRLADAFLAIDTDTLRIADANPAAGALLGLPRDRLLERAALSFMPEASRSIWTTHIDAMSEGVEPRRFQERLQDAQGLAVPVDARVTRFATRRRTLALVLARPV
ncbi:MAG: PAS domain-containing protein [Myxococcota bacterium]